MGKVSNVWKYAKRIDDNNARCNLCETQLTAKGGSTSCVRNHLIGTHHIDVDNITSTIRAPSIASYFVPQKQKISISRSLKLDRMIAAFIAQDARPISIVEGEGFRRLIKFLEPDYDLKSRATITALIKKRYDDGMLKMKQQLDKAQFVAFTTDMWTSIQNIAYMCVTAHWIDPDWTLQACLLQIRETPERTLEKISVYD